MNHSAGGAGAPMKHQGKGRKTGWILPLLVLLSLWGGLQSATQFFAYSFNYNAALGAAYIGKVYAPWAILNWTAELYRHFPDKILQAGGMGIAVSTVGLLLTFIIKIVSANTAKANIHLHGSARWAEREDIEAAGLLPRKVHPLNKATNKALSLIKSKAGNSPSNPAIHSVYVGAWQDKDGRLHYLRHSGPEHVLTYAPTRSGKGVGLVVPTLLAWGASAVITDLKGELWALTAGWRQKHAKNKVLRFEPASNSGSVHWNPLAEIRLDAQYAVGDVQNLVTLIVDPNGKGLADHWQKTAFALLVGVILHALFKAKNEGQQPATLAQIDRMLSNPACPVDELWDEMITYGHCEDGSVHPAVASAAQDMKDRPEEEAGSVLSTAKSYLSLYRDPVIANNTSESQFRIRQLMNHESPVSLYIVTQPNDKDRLRPLVRIMVNMIVRLLADKMEFKDGRPVAHYDHRLLMMLDEFPSLGRLEIMQQSLAFVAGYGIKCYLICQDINQLKDRETGYGQDEAITSNCHVQNAYPPNRIETAEHLSKLTGQTTVVKEQITTSGKRAGMMMGQVSKTFQEVQRPLLTADEAMRMPGPKKSAEGEIIEAGDMVIYTAGFPAIYGKQPLYFQDEVFLARAKIAAPDKSDTLFENDIPEHVGKEQQQMGEAVKQADNA